MVEIIATTLYDALAIESAGADRIELVSALTEGGLTPSYALIKNVIKNTKIPVNVMIRPYSKSFQYSKEEIFIMKEDILVVKSLKANGVVLGVLNESNEICECALNELLSVCDGLDVTFHRAIDELKSPVEGIKVLSKYKKIKTVLTSGGKGSIVRNIPIIQEMIKQSKHINVLIGGGLNFDNIEELVKNTNAPQCHFGTAIRDNNSPYGEINIEKLKILVDRVNELQKNCRGINYEN